uniref:TYR_PHOSPHATASE_2 domain-containing protein n=1 Tax=Gongylonema pulchrum TaxID=637853 RepID=A0A183CVZ2_9BILA
LPEARQRSSDRMPVYCDEDLGSNPAIILHYIGGPATACRFTTFLLRAGGRTLAEGISDVYEQFIKDSPTFFAFFDPENKAKNKYPNDIFLADQSRVVLDEKPDYYHASYVDGCTQCKPEVIVVLMELDPEDESQFLVPPSSKPKKYGAITVKSEDIKKGSSKEESEKFGSFTIVLTKGKDAEGGKEKEKEVKSKNDKDEKDKPDKEEEGEKKDKEEKDSDDKEDKDGKDKEGKEGKDKDDKEGKDKADKEKDDKAKGSKEKEEKTKNSKESEKIKDGKEKDEKVKDGKEKDEKAKDSKEKDEKVKDVKEKDEKAKNSKEKDEKVKDSKEKDEKVEQKYRVIAFNTWVDDMVVPRDDFFKFHETVHKDLKEKPRECSQLVICPTGAHRAGIWAVFDTEAERLKTKDRIRFSETVKSVRSQRCNTIEAFELFDALLNLLVDYAKLHVQNSTQKNGK